MRTALRTIRGHMAWVRPTDAEERANAAVHGAGAVLAAGALIDLVERAAATGSAVAVGACTVFGLSAFVTLAASALFHSAPRDFDPTALLALEERARRRVALPFRDRELWRARRARRRRLWLAVDDCSVFGMIAGTYTPILLLAFPHPLGAGLVAAEWAMAACGVVARLRIGRLHWAMIPAFLGMGWVGFLWRAEIVAGLGPSGSSLLLGGGLVYTAGLVFYLWRSLPFNHALWHAFVVGGAACHYVVIAGHVLPAVA